MFNYCLPKNFFMTLRFFSVWYQLSSIHKFLLTQPDSNKFQMILYPFPTLDIIHGLSKMGPEKLPVFSLLSLIDASSSCEFLFVRNSVTHCLNVLSPSLSQQLLPSKQESQVFCWERHVDSWQAPGVLTQSPKTSKLFICFHLGSLSRARLCRLLLQV